MEASFKSFKGMLDPHAKFLLLQQDHFPAPSRQYLIDRLTISLESHVKGNEQGPEEKKIKEEEKETTIIRGLKRAQIYMPKVERESLKKPIHQKTHHVTVDGDKFRDICSQVAPPDCTIREFTTMNAHVLQGELHQKQDS